MSDSALDRLKHHAAPLLLLSAFCLASNALGLRDFYPRLAFWHDDHPAYYAGRAVEQVQYAGDLFHNELQKSYVLLSGPHWASALLYKYAGVQPVAVVFVLTALKSWLMVFSVYALGYALTGYRFLSAFAAVGVLSSYAVNHNLAGFSFWLFMPYQSDLAYPFIFFALAALPSRRVGVALGMLGITVLIHPSLGLMGYFLVSACILLDRRSYTRTGLVLTLAAAVPLAAAAVLPATYVLRKIPAEELGTARMVYDALNTTHGGLWEWAGGVWWIKAFLFTKVAIFLVPVLLCRDLLQPAARRTLYASLLACTALVVLGALAKFACIWLYETSALSVAIRFHQLLLMRASAFILLFAQALAVIYLGRKLCQDATGLSRAAAWVALLILLDGTAVYSVNAATKTSLFFTLVPVLVFVYDERWGLPTNTDQPAGPVRLASYAVLSLLVIGSYLALTNARFPIAGAGGVMKVAWPIAWTVGAVAVGCFLTTPLPAPTRAVIVAATVGTCGYVLVRSHDTPYQVAMTTTLLLAPLVALLPNLRRTAVTLGVGFAVTVSLVDAAGNIIPARHYAHDWHEAALWARANTPEGSSFLRLTDLPGHPVPDGWRTFSKRGWMSPFNPAWSMVYTPDLRYNKRVDPIYHYVHQKYPGKAAGDLLTSFDAADYAWLRDYFGARYAISHRALRLPFTAVFKNASFAIYDLTAPTRPLTNWVDAKRGAKVVGHSPFCPAPNDPAVVLKAHDPQSVDYAAADGAIPLPHWVDLDLGEPRPIQTVNVRWYTQELRATAFALLGKNDPAEDWTPIRIWADNDAAEVEDALPDPARYRYVRLRVDGAAGQNRLLLRRLSLFGE